MNNRGDVDGSEVQVQVPPFAMKAPKKLVTFLRNNPDSLKYFQYLQAQLQNDVRQYRQRAEQYKRKVLRLEQQVLELQQKSKDDHQAVDSDISDEDDAFEMEQLKEMEKGIQKKNDQVTLNQSTFGDIQQSKVERKKGIKRSLPSSPSSDKGIMKSWKSNEFHQSISIDQAEDQLKQKAYSILKELGFNTDNISSKSLVAKARSIMKDSKYSSTHLCPDLDKFTEALLLLSTGDEVTCIINSILHEISSGQWHKSTLTTLVERYYWAQLIHFTFMKQESLQKLLEIILIYSSTRVENFSLIVLDGLVNNFPIAKYMKAHNLSRSLSLLCYIVHEKISRSADTEEEKASARSLTKAFGLDAFTKGTTPLRVIFETELNRLLNFTIEINNTDTAIVAKIILCNLGVEVILKTIKSCYPLIKSGVSSYRNIILCDDSLEYDLRFNDVLLELCSDPNSSSLSNVTMFDLATQLSSASIADKILQERKLIPVEMKRNVITAHVINLERRRDRLSKFLGRAIRSGLCVDFACCGINQQSNIDDVISKPKHFISNTFTYAYDADEDVNGAIVLKQWDPSTISMYDRLAPKKPVLVNMTASERACALSHVCAWIQCILSIDRVSQFYLI